jgi:hypothetical protein
VNIAGAGSGSATLTIATTAAQGPVCTSIKRRPGPEPWLAGGGAVLSCLLFFGIPGRCRTRRAMLGMSVLLAVLGGGMLACGGGGGQACGTAVAAGTTAGIYTITITGASGTTTATGTVTLTVE